MRARTTPGMPGLPGRRVVTYLLVLLAVGVVAAPASAQGVTVELRAGAAVGNYTETDAGLDIVPAPSFAAVAELRLTESVAGYAGLTRSAFGCEEALCANRDMSLASQGLVVGARYAPGVLWARAGLVAQVLRISSDVRTETRDPGIGWDVGGGLDVPVGRGFRVRPGITYLRHGVPTADGDEHVALLAVEVGVAYGL